MEKENANIAQIVDRLEPGENKSVKMDQGDNVSKSSFRSAIRRGPNYPKSYVYNQSVCSSRPGELNPEHFTNQAETKSVHLSRQALPEQRINSSKKEVINSQVNELKSQLEKKPVSKKEEKSKFSSYNIPFSPTEKSNYYQRDLIDNKVQRRIKMTEKVAEQMENAQSIISNKDKFITKKGQETNYFYGKMEDYHMKKVREKYDKISKQNENYVDKKIGLDNYFKSYVDNTKPVSLEQIEKENIIQEDQRLNKQEKYYKDLNAQLDRNKKIKNKKESEYKKYLDEDKKKADAKYMKEQNEKDSQKNQRKKDFYEINKKIIDSKKENEKKIKISEIEFDNRINDMVSRQINYMEEKEIQRKEDKKNSYRKALDNQIKNQEAKAKRIRDIERGNF